MKHFIFFAIKVTFFIPSDFGGTRKKVVNNNLI